MRTTIPIVSSEDPRIEAYRDIRERDLVGRHGLFVIEGEVVLRSALARGRHRLASLLLAENRVAALGDLLPVLDPAVPVFTASAEVLEGIAGFAVHRGVLAIGERRPDPGAAALLAGLPEDALVLVAAGIANHDNIGGLFRNAAAFGVDAVLLDHASCDPLYRKAIRVSTGSALALPFSRGGTLEGLHDALIAAGFSLIATSPAGREDLLSVKPERRTAVVMGAEGPGLPASFLAACRTVRISMAPGCDSLNVATAAAIVLHQLAALRPPRLNTSSTRPTVRNR
ncbi:MAG: TrmH family RNA methyltransferase [Labrys sp. (in: a-proteobacteria)]